MNGFDLGKCRKKPSLRLASTEDVIKYEYIEQNAVHVQNVQYMYATVCYVQSHEDLIGTRHTHTFIQ